MRSTISSNLTPEASASRRTSVSTGFEIFPVKKRAKEPSGFKIAFIGFPPYLTALLTAGPATVPIAVSTARAVGS